MGDMERGDVAGPYFLGLRLSPYSSLQEAHRQAYSWVEDMQAHIAAHGVFAPSFSVHYSEVGKKVDEFGGVTSDRTLIFSCRRFL
jgi:hypothetical protein